MSHASKTVWNALNFLMHFSTLGSNASEPEVLNCAPSTSLHAVSRSVSVVKQGKHTLHMTSYWPAGVKQVMAVDVLTGKSRRVHHDHTIRSPPKIEDESIGM